MTCLSPQWISLPSLFHFLANTYDFAKTRVLISRYGLKSWWNLLAHSPLKTELLLMIHFQQMFLLTHYYLTWNENLYDGFSGTWKINFFIINWLRKKYSCCCNCFLGTIVFLYNKSFLINITKNFPWKPTWDSWVLERLHNTFWKWIDWEKSDYDLTTCANWNSISLWLFPPNDDMKDHRLLTFIEIQILEKILLKILTEVMHSSV